jgi:RNA polymerase sigma factor (sigma-70 family)
MAAVTAHSVEQLFVEAVEQFYALITDRLAVITRDRSAAEDLTQEVFARLWSQLSRGTQVENTWCFLRRIMQNVGLEYLRGRRKTNTQPLEHLPDGRARSPAAQAEHAEEIERIRRLVHELRREEQELIFSWYVLELSGPEIAKALKLPRRTALDRIYGTIAKLAGRMGVSKRGHEDHDAG